MTDEEIERLTNRIAQYPESGDEIQGTGGCRKIRIAGRGKGKSGGYRVITFFTGPNLPVFLLTVFSKGERADLSARERGNLKGMTKELVAAYSKKVVQASKRA